MTRGLDEIKAAARAGKPLTATEENLIIVDFNRQSDDFNARPGDLEERRAIQEEGNSCSFRRLGEGRYQLDKPEARVTLEVDRLRRESGALLGELVVRCTLPGAFTHDGVLSAGDINLSSVRARQDRGKYLNARARVDDIDFTGMLEELSQRVIAAERDGEPLVMLRDVPRSAPDETFVIDGLPLLMHLPMMIFGDGATAKSLLALYIAGRLQQQGHRVCVYDWELDASDHRGRLEALFGPEMPAVRYHRATAPLVDLADRVRRDVAQDGLDFVVFDSVGFACDGAPELAEVALRYCNATRRIGRIGSLHIAHVTKGDGGDLKPFGSVFWSNAMRSTWNCKLAEGDPGAETITIGLYHRKVNIGATRPPLAWEITFGPDRTAFHRTDMADTPDLAVALTTRQRIFAAVRHGAISIGDLADRLELKPDTIEKTVKRAAKVFSYIPGPNGSHLVGLRQRQP